MTESLAGALERQTQTPKARNVLDLLEAHTPDVRRALGSDDAVERFARIVRTAMQRNPIAQESDPYAFLGAALQLARLDLEPGPLGLVCLIASKRAVSLIVGYRGYATLAYRAGVVRSLVARAVHDGDTFGVTLGTSAKITHVSAGAPDGREIVAAYAVAKLTTGGTVAQAIYPAEWETVAKRTPRGAAGGVPLLDHAPSLALTCAVRALVPDLPHAPTLAHAYAIDGLPAPRLDDLIAEQETGMPAPTPEVTSDDD